MPDQPDPEPDWELTDGVITIRPPRPGEASILIAGRDDESRRWLGPGEPHPQPTACVLAGDTIVGWVDYDTDRDWLGPGEINLGYNVFARYRGKAYASRAVLLLLRRLAVDGRYRVATLSIERDNHASLAVPAKAGFELVCESPRNLRFARSIPDAEEA